jgi:hypothetical protein
MLSYDPYDIVFKNQLLEAHDRLLRVEFSIFNDDFLSLAQDALFIDVLNASLALLMTPSPGLVLNAARTRF